MDQTLIPYTAKKDVHWDFVLKEMIWLANDFQREKKRHIDKGKTISKDIKKYHGSIKLVIDIYYIVLFYYHI